MEFTHQIQQFAASVPSLWPMAERQAQEWDQAVLEMAALQPGDPNAEEVLCGGAALLQSITVNYPCGEWGIVQAHKIWGHAERVFGKGQLKFNRPVETLGTGGGGLRRSREYMGMRLKFVHPEGF